MLSVRLMDIKKKPIKTSKHQGGKTYISGKSKTIHATTKTIFKKTGLVYVRSDKSEP